eukprot:CAMPEP_0178411818 /NCGR_PEP_ID=MMETSP0689_2-20121128/21691_1 /TAXON_ID=160604 /ORGANISM="Amphidinium massartii, Strain CS-259" /LENGTH=192 /DNA_ID=CAMNT_0020033037 /DNA_START=131 /DNA_END=707 /DNA_ORIENTATION=+
MALAANSRLVMKAQMMEQERCGNVSDANEANDTCSTTAPSPSLTPAPSPPWTRHNSPCDEMLQDSTFTVPAHLETYSTGSEAMQQLKVPKADPAGNGAAGKGNNSSVLLAVAPKERFSYFDSEDEDGDEGLYFALSVRRWALHNAVDPIEYLNLKLPALSLTMIVLTSGYHMRQPWVPVSCMLIVDSFEGLG